MQTSYKCYTGSLKAGGEKRKEKIGEYSVDVYLNITIFVLFFQVRSQGGKEIMKGMILL